MDETETETDTKREAEHYGPWGWIMGLGLSAVLLWAMFALSDSL